MVRGALEGSDHYAVVVKILLRDKWEFCRKTLERARGYINTPYDVETEVGKASG